MRETPHRALDVARSPANRGRFRVAAARSTAFHPPAGEVVLRLLVEVPDSDAIDRQERRGPVQGLAGDGVLQ